MLQEWFAGHISSLADQLGAAKQQKSQFVHPGGSMVKVTFKRKDSRMFIQTNTSYT